MYDYDLYREYLDTMHQKPFSFIPSEVIDGFHTEAQDDWSPGDDDIQYFHLYGLQRSKRTIRRLIAVNKRPSLVELVREKLF